MVHGTGFTRGQEAYVALILLHEKKEILHTNIDTSTRTADNLVGTAIILHDQRVHDCLLLCSSQDAFFDCALCAQTVAVHGLFLPGERVCLFVMYILVYPSDRIVWYHEISYFIWYVYRIIHASTTLDIYQSN